MKCPKCNLELVQIVRHKVDMQTCPSCKGMWLDARELDQLENETFDLGEDEKGMLVYDAMSTTQPCPVCAAHLKRFNYHAYALQMDACPNEHGFWLDAGADDEVLKLMADEEHDYKRSVTAEAQWGRTLQRMRSGSFLEKLRGLFH